MHDPGVLRRRFVLTAAAGLALYVVLGIYGDVRVLVETLADFPWLVAPVVILLTLGNYAGRLLKWHWYLRLVGVRLPWRESTRVFGAGMAMVLTPGKAGELLKSYMVKNLTGVPMRVTAPIVLAERLTDGLAMLLLASVGLWSLPDPALRRMGLLAAAAMLGVVLVVQLRPVALLLLGAGRRLPWLGRRLGGLGDFYESSYVLLRWHNLVPAVAIGTVSWALEAGAYYLVLLGLGVPRGIDEALTAVFIFSISAIVGALVATPGGLGGTEAGLVGLSQSLLDLARGPATAGALLIRFATLWFGVGIGIACLARWPGLVSGAASVRPTRTVRT